MEQPTARSAQSARHSQRSIAHLGLACHCGHQLLPDRASAAYLCGGEEGCGETVLPAEAAQRVDGVRMSFEGLKTFIVARRFHSGCRAAQQAELSARDVLAPQHHLWLLWVAAAGALAAKVTNSSLLLLVCAKRKAMAAALRPEDVYLAIQFAVAVGFGSDAATESLLSAFHIDQSLGEESGAVDFIERWMPEGPMWGPRVRTAAGVALGLTVRPPNLLVPSDLQFNGRMRSLAEQRSAMTKEHTLKLAVAAIREWEQSRDDERDDEEEEMTHVFARARPQDLERVWRIEQAFDGDECDRIMAAVDAAADARGWDKDRHGKYPTTDMPMTAIGEMESEIRQMLFSRVLRPLAPLYLPEPFLPEHLQFIDLFFVKCGPFQIQPAHSHLSTGPPPAIGTAARCHAPAFLLPLSTAWLPLAAWPPCCCHPCFHSNPCFHNHPFFHSHPLFHSHLCPRRPQPHPRRLSTCQAALKKTLPSPASPPVLRA